MSEIAGKKKVVKSKEEKVVVEKGPIEIEEPSPFTPEEMARMIKVKAEVAGGRYTDITDEHRKLLFVEWMIDNGKLKS